MCAQASKVAVHASQGLQGCRALQRDLHRGEGLALSEVDQSRRRDRRCVLASARGFDMTSLLLEMLPNSGREDASGGIKASSRLTLQGAEHAAAEGSLCCQQHQECGRGRQDGAGSCHGGQDAERYFVQDGNRDSIPRFRTWNGWIVCIGGALASCAPSDINVLARPRRAPSCLAAARLSGVAGWPVASCAFGM